MPKILYIIIVLAFSCVSRKQAPVTIIHSPASHNSEEPYLYNDHDGKLLMSWIERQDSSGLLKYALYQNENWGEAVTITEGKDWFINWADYPVITMNGTGMLAHILKKSGPGTFAYDINLFHSNDGKTWQSKGLLNQDGLQAEHGFVTMLPYNEGFLVSWLDGRNTMASTHDSISSHAGHHGAMTLRAAIINKSGQRSKEWELDHRVCDCCQTGGAITQNGPVIVYRDRSRNEIRDIAIVRYESGSWSAPSIIFQDNWSISGCPVNGPRADAMMNTLVVTWYTGAEGHPVVKTAFSTDGGRSFGLPITISEAKPLGRVDVLLYDQKTAVVSWMEGPQIMVMKVTESGEKGIPVRVAQSSDARSSGFPQMTRYKEQLLFAWTNDTQKRIQVATLNIEDLI